LLLDPEDGFTAAEIRDARRFVGRSNLIRDCVKALNSPVGLLAVYGRRGVGKSSLLRQIQNMANGDYAIASKAGQYHLVPPKPRKYYTVYYTCDAIITDANSLLTRLCNDQHSEDGLLRLVPDKGKELVEFSRAEESSLGVDLKLVQWGDKGTDSSKYARVVPGDVVQTFRNFVESVVEAITGCSVSGTQF
jgi:AAA ATPase domain